MSLRALKCHRAHLQQGAARDQVGCGTPCPRPERGNTRGWVVAGERGARACPGVSQGGRMPGSPLPSRTHPRVASAGLVVSFSSAVSVSGTWLLIGAVLAGGLVCAFRSRGPWIWSVSGAWLLLRARTGAPGGSRAGWTACCQDSPRVSLSRACLCQGAAAAAFACSDRKSVV